MISWCKNALVVLFLVILVMNQVTHAEAAKGIPGSPAFGFGAMLYPSGPMLDKALILMKDLRPDWLYVPISWADTYVSADAKPDLAALDQVMAAAAQEKIAVVLSVSDAPLWAQTQAGPDAHMAAQFAVLLVQRYPGTVQALELFPRANTLIGWGSAPNPHAYLTVFKTVQTALNAAGSDALLVAAGLQPQDREAASQDAAIAIDDLAFLQGLYDAGGKDVLRVISLQYADMNSDLLASPLNTESLIFRHYEPFRALMLANGHAEGVMWITSFGLPSGLYGHARVNPNNMDEQAKWLQQGYSQLLAQLYVGTAIMQSLNPAPAETDTRAASILQPDESLHPFYHLLRKMSEENDQGSSSLKPGSAKAGNLAKNR
jgi:hypothetical protein